MNRPFEDVFKDKIKLEQRCSAVAGLSSVGLQAPLPSTVACQRDPVDCFGIECPRRLKSMQAYKNQLTLASLGSQWSALGRLEDRLDSIHLRILDPRFDTDRFALYPGNVGKITFSSRGSPLRLHTPDAEWGEDETRCLTPSSFELLKDRQLRRRLARNGCLTRETHRLKREAPSKLRDSGKEICRLFEKSHNL